LICLFPGEADQTHHINNDDGHGDNIAENGFHPLLDLHALAGVGLGQEIVPTPAIALVAAEDHEHQRTQRQQVGGDQEVPQIQPGRAFGKGLELKYAVTQSSGGRSQSQNNTADDSKLSKLTSSRS